MKPQIIRRPSGTLCPLIHTNHGRRRLGRDPLYLICVKVITVRTSHNLQEVWGVEKSILPFRGDALEEVQRRVRPLRGRRRAQLTVVGSNGAHT